MTRQVVRFAAIGVVSTLAYLVLFVALHPFMGAQLANFMALALTAIANTSANRRFTFGVRDRAGAGRHQLQGFGVFLLGLGITSGSLALLQATAPNAGRLLELTVLVVANLAATVLRFLLMRGWIFKRAVAAAG